MDHNAPKNQDPQKDRELKRILTMWEAPEVPPSLDARMMASFRKEIARPPFWKRFFSSPVFVPMPLAAGMAACMAGLLVLSVTLLVHKAEKNDLQSASSSKPQEIVRVVEVPKEIIREKVVPQIVYVEKHQRQPRRESIKPPSVERSTPSLDITDSTPTVPTPGSGSVVVRDFTLQDVRLRVQNPRLLVNGELLSTAAGSSETCSGSLIWFSLPDGGRMICAIAPQAGYAFQKMGVVEGTKLTLSLNETTYEWISAVPILGTEGKWSLWVFYDQSFTTNQAQDKHYTIGSANTIEQLLKKN